MSPDQNQCSQNALRFTMRDVCSVFALLALLQRLALLALARLPRLAAEARPASCFLAYGDETPCLRIRIDGVVLSRRSDEQQMPQRHREGIDGSLGAHGSLWRRKEGALC